MVRPERDPIGGEHAVEVDECFIGGVHNKAIVVGAVEVRLRKDAEQRKAKFLDAHSGGIPLKKLIYAGRLRLRTVPHRSAPELMLFINQNIAKGTTVRTDSNHSYQQVKGFYYEHERVNLSKEPDKAETHLPMIHLVFSNLKTWILGTHHGRIEPHHLQAYLNEYTYRFNRRFYPMTAFNSVLGLAAKSESPTYKELYSQEWVHPN